MTVVAGVGGVDMRRIFRGGGGAVVTTRTRAGHRTVIEVHRGPVCRHMTIVTGIGALNMVRRLAGRRRAVVATRAGADDCGVVDGRYRFPGG